jgi:hypothetical protein
MSPKVAEVERLYGKYNPEKLSDVPVLVEKYGEDKLLAMVMKKYREQEEKAHSQQPRQPPPQQLPPQEEPVGQAAAMALQQHIAKHGTGDVQKIRRLRRASVQTVGAPGSLPVVQKTALDFSTPAAKVGEVRRLYVKYDPEKVAGVPGLVQKYGEDKLFSMVWKKYEAQEGRSAPDPRAGDASASYSIQPQARESPKVVEVQRLYGKYNPEKLADVPGLVEKYGEDKLLAMVKKKYKEQEEAAPSPKEAQVRRLYGKYNPEKLADVPTLLAKYGEDQLQAMVKKKYREQEEEAAKAEFESSEDEFEADEPAPAPGVESLSDDDAFDDGYAAPAPAGGLGRVVISSETLLQAAMDGDEAVLAHCLASGQVWVDEGRTAILHCHPWVILSQKKRRKSEVWWNGIAALVCRSGWTRPTRSARRTTRR